jgi:hypothetical protein
MKSFKINFGDQSVIHYSFDPFTTLDEYSETVLNNEMFSPLFLEIMDFLSLNKFY